MKVLLSRFSYVLTSDNRLIRFARDSATPSLTPTNIFMSVASFTAARIYYDGDQAHLNNGEVKTGVRMAIQPTNPDVIKQYWNKGDISAKWRTKWGGNTIDSKQGFENYRTTSSTKVDPKNPSKIAARAEAGNSHACLTILYTDAQGLIHHSVSHFS